MSVFGSMALIQSYCKNPNHAQRRPNHRSDDRSKENWETHEIERENTKKKWKRSSQGVSPAVVCGRAAARIAAVAGRRGRDRGARGVENANQAAESRSRSRPGAGPGRGVGLCEREGSRAGFVCRRFLATQATAQLLMGCGTDEEELKEENNNLGVGPPAGPEKRSNLPREASAADMTLRQQTWYCSLVWSKRLLILIL